MCGGCCSQHWHFKINLHLDFWVHKNRDLNQGSDLFPGAILLFCVGGGVQGPPGPPDESRGESAACRAGELRCCAEP